MVATGAISSSAMDHSVPAIDYLRHRSRPVRPSDQILQSYEVFQSLTSSSTFHPLYRRYAGVSLPWIADNSSDTQTALAEFDAMVAEWRQEHPQASAQSPQLAERIFTWITDPNGFGMVHDPAARERSFNGLVQNRRGDCTEFLYAMMVFYRRAGFSVRPMWVGTDMDGHSNVHVCAEVRAGSRRILVDPIFQFDAPHRATAPLSGREILGWYWNNRGIDQYTQGSSRAWARYERAAAIDPFNAHLWVNRADYQYAQGDLPEARRQLAHALRLAPNFSPAEERLGNWAFDRRDFAQAATHYRRALGTNADNLVARDNLIRTLVELREGTPARAQLTELRRRAPQYPHLRTLETLVRACPP